MSIKVINIRFYFKSILFYSNKEEIQMPRMHNKYEEQKQTINKHDKH